MKDKVLIFIIGLLVGAIIATASFLVYFKFFKEDEQSNPGTMQMDDNGQMGGGDEMGDPPDMTEGNGNGDGEVPEKPDGEDGEAPSDDGGSMDTETTEI